VISFGSGIACAYVFVHLMPELHGTRQALAASSSAPLRFEGKSVYFVALLGFLMYYGLEHLRSGVRKHEAEGTGPSGRSFRLHVAGFAAYVGVMAFLLSHALEPARSSLPLYAGTIAVHFLSVDHALREEHGEAYERRGRIALAAMCLAGWAAGVVTEIPRGVLALVVAFVSGAVIMNSSIMELPEEKDGRFVPFLVGGLAYGLALIPLG